MASMVEGRIGANVEAGLVPSFRAGERTRVRGWFDGAWHPAPWCVVDARMELRSDHHPDGTRQSGAGDLELGTLLALPLRVGLPVPGLGWSVKLPNAGDATELGTDETDITLYALTAMPVSTFHLVAGGGLAILGDPIRYASQDDMPFIFLRVVTPEALRLRPAAEMSFHWGFLTTRNPARGQVGARVGWGDRLRAGLDGSVGLSPAAADWTGGLWLGLAWDR